MSKRLHSIFMLRCFNDCFAVLGLWLAIFCYQRDQWHLGSFFYSTGLNVKMSLLLPLPAMGVLMVQKLGGREALTQAMIIFQVSVRCVLLINMLVLTVYRSSMAILSANARRLTLHALLSSAELSFTSGQSIGASFRNRPFFPSPLLLVYSQLMRACSCGMPGLGG